LKLPNKRLNRADAGQYAEVMTEKGISKAVQRNKSCSQNGKRTRRSEMEEALMKELDGEPLGGESWQRNDLTRCVLDGERSREQKKLVVPEGK
jgi:hypothetical protein